MPVEDSYIAAIARRHNLVIATGNDRDYRRPGLKVFNRSKSSGNGVTCRPLADTLTRCTA
jgi:hypothetical protein